MKENLPYAVYSELQRLAHDDQFEKSFQILEVKAENSFQI